ncbi:MAG: 50S ribosomal protein L25 [bacterium]|nr:50S ribosomal protein L25 [bacterium]
MTINAESRNEVGKKIAKKLRNEGRIPAIIYGGKKESIPVSLLISDLKEVLKSETGENTVLKIVRDDIQVDAMLKEIQMDYLSDNYIHVDLIRIDLTKELEVNVHITITGEAIGVKVEGGIFDFMTREVRVKCLATAIPKELVLDVSELHIGQTIKVAELEIPDGVKLLSDTNSVVCSVSMKGVLDEEEEGEEGEEGIEGEEAVAEGEEAATE